MTMERLDARRMLAAYAPDIAWGTDGRLAGTIGAGLIGIHADRAYVTQASAEEVSAVKRYQADGTLDPSFKPFSQQAKYDFTMVDDAGRAMLFSDHDQSLVVCRLTRDGTPDARFGKHGVVTIPLAWNASIPTFKIATQSAAIDADGSMFVLVEYSHSFEIPDSGRSHRYYNSVRLIKLTPARQLDASFGQAGVVTINDRSAIDANLTVDTEKWLGLAPGGRPMVGIVKTFDFGDSSGNVNVTRFTTAGAIDTTYATSGQLYLRAAFGGDFRAQNLGLDAQGRLVIGQLLRNDSSDPTATPRLLRYDARGRSDRSFGNHGAVLPMGTDLHDYAIRGFLVRPDGTVTLHMADRIARVSPDGTPDTSFDEDGFAEAPGMVGALLGELSDGTMLARTKQAGTLEPTGIGRINARPDVDQSDTGAVSIYGTAGDDAIAVAAAGTHNRYVVYIGGLIVDQPLDTVTSIYVETFGGDDVVYSRFVRADLVIPMQVTSGDGNDTLRGTSQNDTLDAGYGDDLVEPGDGRDEVALGEGDNRLTDTAGGANVTALSTSNLDAASDDVNTVDIVGGGSYLGRSGSVVLSIAGEQANVDTRSQPASVININASISATVLCGSGNDTITSTGGSDDYIVPGPGSDRVFAGDGNDIVAGESGPVSMGETANDYFDLGAGNDIGKDGVGNNTILGGDGNDSIVGGIRSDVLAGGLGKDTLRGGAGDDLIDGGGGTDRLFGQDGNDHLTGGGHNDVLVGGAGADTLVGNQGDDLLVAGTPGFVSDSLNTLDGGAGIDSALRENEDDDLVSIEAILTELL